MKLPGTINGFIAWGGNPPTCKLSADGSVFWGRNEKGGGSLWYSVYQVMPTGAVFLKWRSAPSTIGAGQGLIDVQPNGELWVTLYASAGDNQEAIHEVVPGFISAPLLKGPKGDTGIQGPKGDKGDPGAQGPKGDPGASGSGSTQDPNLDALRKALKAWLMG